jgi:hypothetical protein
MPVSCTDAIGPTLVTASGDGIDRTIDTARPGTHRAVEGDGPAGRRRRRRPSVPSRPMRHLIILVVLLAAAWVALRVSRSRNGRDV